VGEKGASMADRDDMVDMAQEKVDKDKDKEKEKVQV
jgi:hypothetical protein